MGAMEPGRVASPSELADELGEPLHQVGYHIRQLAKWGCLEFVEDREVRGTVEHFYRVGERPFYDHETWSALDPVERSVALRGVLSDVLADIAGADVRGALHARLESHVTRTPLELDDHGWVELDALLVALLDGAHEIAAKSAARIASGESRPSDVSAARLLLVAIPAAAPASSAEIREPNREPVRLDNAGSLRGRAPSSTLAQLYKALSHPLRARLLSELVGGRVASPSELAKEFETPLHSVNYHIHQLDEWGCLELVHKRKRRGAIEHLYGVAQHPYYDAESWKRLTPERRVAVGRAVLTAVLADIVGAEASGVLDGQHDFHITRSPLELDDRGWEEVDARMVTTLAQVSKIAADATNRPTSGESGLQPARLMMLLIPAAPRPEQKLIS